MASKKLKMSVRNPLDSTADMESNPARSKIPPSSAEGTAKALFLVTESSDCQVCGPVCCRSLRWRLPPMKKCAGRRGMKGFRGVRKRYFEDVRSLCAEHGVEFSFAHYGLQVFS